MSHPQSCKVVFGAAGPLWREHAQEVIALLREAGVDEIDVAQVYLDSEKTAGDVGAARYFRIGTKELGCGGLIVGDGPPTKENVIRRALHSLGLLKVDKVDIFYIHGPDRTTPFEETLEGIDELYKMGKFNKFGLSNFLPDEVEKVSWFLHPSDFLLQLGLGHLSTNLRWKR
jgi:aryl-alcohol dehydrogenase-like predicted oxidoreductase